MHYDHTAGVKAPWNREAAQTTQMLSELRGTAVLLCVRHHERRALKRPHLLPKGQRGALACFSRPVTLTPRDTTPPSTVSRVRDNGPGSDVGEPGTASPPNAGAWCAGAVGTFFERSGHLSGKITVALFRPNLLV